MPARPSSPPCLRLAALALSAAACLAGTGGAPLPARAASGSGGAGPRPAGGPGVVWQWGQFGGGRPRPLPGAGGPRHRREGSPEGVGPVRSAPTLVRGIRGTVVQVASSNAAGYALTASGAVYAWGAAAQGELGDGVRRRLSLRAVRVRLPAGVRIRALANPMPYDAAMAIARDGTVWAWGNDRAREFCRPAGRILRTPVRVPLVGVTLTAGALRHALYDSRGRILSCGEGPLGQLGDGRAGPGTHSARPVPVLGLPAGRAVALTSAWGNAGVLMADGRYYDWGYNRGGQVGDGTRALARTATRVPLPRAVARVFQGGSYGDNGQSIALLRGGGAWVWGNGRFGQIGAGDRHGALRPVPLSALRGQRLVAVSSGGSTTYAIGRSGTLWAWGNNHVGQLGNGSAARLALSPVRDRVRVAQVSSTAHNTVALGASAG